MPAIGASRFFLISFESAFKRGDVDDLSLVRERSVKSLPNEIADRRHEGGQRLAGTGRAAISTLRLALIAGQACVCVAVGARKLRSNQATTAGWNNAD